MKNNKNKQSEKNLSNKNALVILAFILLCAFHVNVIAASIDIRSEYEHWESGLGGTSSSLMIGVGGSHKLNSKISLGGSVITGKFSTDAQAVSDTSRTDFDVVLNYQLYPTMPIYVGYQQRRLSVVNEDDRSRSFDDIQHGVGLGITKYVPIKRRWLLFGGMTFNAIVAASDLKGGPTDRGKGFSSSIRIGTLYSISQIFSLGLSVKARSTNVDYGGDAGHWSHNSYAIAMSASRAW